MAKVLIEVDTVDKTFSVTIDGKTVDNVISASLYKKNNYYDGPDTEMDDDEDDQCYLDISIMEKMDDGMTTHTRICASNHETVKAAKEEGRAVYELQEMPGYVVVEQPSPADIALKNDIASFLRKA